MQSVFGGRFRKGEKTFVTAEQVFTAGSWSGVQTELMAQQIKVCHEFRTSEEVSCLKKTLTKDTKEHNWNNTVFLSSLIVRNFCI